MKKVTTKKKKTTKEIDKIVRGVKKELKASGELSYAGDPYTASIKIFGRVYTSIGFTVKEAIENMKVGTKVGGVCVMTVTKGDVKKEKILNAGQLFRLFTASRIMHEIAIKNVCSLFSDI